MNTHHLFWPRKSYTTKLERTFRILPCNVVKIDKGIHRLIHAHQNPPKKPKHDEMAEAIRRHDSGQCACTTTTRLHIADI